MLTIGLKGENLSHPVSVFLLERKTERIILALCSLPEGKAPEDPVSFF
jgi:hypothetical protein